MAEAANTAGEELFRRCDFLGAQKRFSEASKLAPREPKYALNLAKAFFEQGKYEACVKTARVAWQKISPKAIIDSNDIAVQVASLYARARIYDAYRRRLDSDGDSASTNSPPTQVQVNAAQEKLAAQIASAIEGFIERGLEGDNPVFDASFGVFWRQFRNVEEERTEEEKEKVVKAGRHLWSIPILKAELHKNAHLRKFEAEPFYSITENLIVDINTKDASGLPIEKRNGRAVLVGSSAILIAGFGDGRNVLGNIIIHGKFLKDVTSMGRSGLRASERTLHVTAVEIEPALVSRFLITLWLLERLQEKKRAKEEKGVSEIVATLLFLHTTLIMPGYCADWVQQAIDALLALLAEGRTHLFSSIHISASSIEPITYFLRLWSTVRSLRTVKDFLASNPISDRHPVKRLPEKPSALLAKGVKGVDQRPGSSEPIYNDVDKELVECHLKLRVLFPPKNLLGRHPAVAKFVKCRGVPSRELAMAAEDEIETTWAVNVTLFDPLNLVDDSTEPYPRVTDNPFDALFRFLTKTREAVKDKQMSPGKTAIAIATNWFMLASDVMAWWGEKLTVEILVGDVYRAMPLLVEGDLGPRPEGFPRKYMRVGMNTLPDQNQGLIPIATSILPFVDVVDKAEVMMDTDMRPGDKRVSVAHFYYQHTLLQARDIPKFLGLTVFYNPNDVNNIPIYFRPPQLPRPLKELASKDALINWLTALLFAIISDGQADAPPNDQTTSLTLGGFFELLVHLHRVGFPGHWMGDFVGDLVEGRIETRVRPYHGTLPREICEHGCEPPGSPTPTPRAIDLQFLQAEVEATLALIWRALPFPVALPDRFKAKWEDEVETYQAPVELAGDEYLGPKYSKAVQLVFFRPRRGVPVWRMVERLHRRLEGGEEGEGAYKCYEVEWLRSEPTAESDEKEKGEEKGEEGNVDEGKGEEAEVEVEEGKVDDGDGETAAMEDGEANGGCQNKDGQDVDEEKRSGEGKETGTNAEDGEKTESGGGVDDPRSEDRGDDQVEKPAEDTSTSTAEVTSDSPIENAEGEASKPQNGEAAPQTPAHDLSTANGCGSEESAETPGVPLSDAAEKGSNQGEVTDTTEEANEDDEELPDDGEDEIQIITQSLEEPRNGNLVWYMSKRWKEKMVEEGWEVVAYRDDYRIIVTTSSPASEWTVYDPEDHTCTEECLGGHELPGESKE